MPEVMADMFLLTKDARRALKRHREGGHLDVSDDAVLMLELADRIGGCGLLSNIERMTRELIDHFGDAESAIAALRSGQVTFSKAS